MKRAGPPGPAHVLIRRLSYFSFACLCGEQVLIPIADFSSEHFGQVVPTKQSSSYEPNVRVFFVVILNELVRDFTNEVRHVYPDLITFPKEGKITQESYLLETRVHPFRDVCFHGRYDLTPRSRKIAGVLLPHVEVSTKHKPPLAWASVVIKRSGEEVMRLILQKVIPDTSRKDFAFYRRAKGRHMHLTCKGTFPSKLYSSGQEESTS